ncbi:hypothetical protein N7541_000040 [Penicillium brevicompactum]|uniref:NACHT domain-containing protein n=1 Tax=Penicillium brevicompactum TaxID=5074 RepID=A0A9W9V394_PENBR|nr:hypothetical protein N7541_000040 [Penicillium brevicompactum]
MSSSKGPRQIHQDRQSKDRCLDYFAVTDPRDSYEWILRHPQFQCWRGSNDSQVLWVKGDPGKGKTMLLCGIIDELRPTTKLEVSQAKAFLSFFFCQATVPKLSNAHAVLRGLIYMLIKQHPLFLPHVQERFKDTGEPRFGDAEAWIALCNMFSDIVRESSLERIYVVVDALDECVQDQDKLLQFILNESKDFPHVKWIISSRNHVEQRTRLLDSQSILSLELHENAESVYLAIEAYITNKTAGLESLRDEKNLLAYVQQALQRKADGTFLWVALVIQELEHVDRWKIRQVVNDVPKGLNDLYERMIDQIKRLAREDMECCKLILSATALAYRPLQLLELGVVSGLPDEIAGNAKNIETMIKRSGSFLTVRDSIVYFVHQSAKDYLIEQAGLSIFSSGFPAAHRRMLRQSLQAMSKTLRRDIYGLQALGTPIDRTKQPTPDPLAAVGYSCIYWVDHLEESGRVEAMLRLLYLYWLRLVCLFWGLLGESLSLTTASGLCQGGLGTSTLDGNMEDHDAVGTFLRERYLYWLEALSLLRGMTEGIKAIQKLEFLLQEHSRATELQELVQDAYRFIRYHRAAIENSPLQAYSSGMVFSPLQSMVKQLFWHERPENIAMEPPMGYDWDAHTGTCLQTLEGHDQTVNSVKFSHDSSRVASGSGDNTIKFWDAHTGACLQTLEGHGKLVTSVVFSHDSSRVASGSGDKTIKIWDAHTGACLQTLEGHGKLVTSVVFSHDSSRVASGSFDKTIKIWDSHTGACLKTIEGHGHWVNPVAFSHDSSRVASGSRDKTIKIWDPHTGAYLQTLEGHDSDVISVVFSHNSSRVASGSGDKLIKIWDPHTGACLQTLKGHDQTVSSVTFSHDSSRVASGSFDKTIKIWDAETGACLQTLKGHDQTVNSVTFSHDSSRVASASWDKTIKIWNPNTDVCRHMLEGHDGFVHSVVFSQDSSFVASGSDDKTIKVWDPHTGACLQTLKGHDRGVISVVFSYDSSRVASGSDDKTIKIWHPNTGACLQTLKGHDQTVSSVTFSHDSSRVASGSFDKTIKIWDAQIGACLQTLEGHDDWVYSVVFSQDSSRVASGSDDKTIKIWDPHTGACLQTLKGHDRGVISVVFSYDSSRVASGSKDSTINIWDVHTGACMQSLCIGSAVHNLSFDTTGSSLYTNIGIIAICDTPTSAPTTSKKVLHSEFQSPLACQELQVLKHHGYGICSDSFWITRHSKKWLWLPSMYRPIRSAVGQSGLVLVLGCRSGRVLIFRFAADDCN